MNGCNVIWLARFSVADGTSAGSAKYRPSIARTMGSATYRSLREPGMLGKSVIMGVGTHDR
jgi:hypothetical protein